MSFARILNYHVVIFMTSKNVMTTRRDFLPKNEKSGVYILPGGVDREKKVETLTCALFFVRRPRRDDLGVRDKISIRTLNISILSCALSSQHVIFLQVIAQRMRETHGDLAWRRSEHALSR